MNDFPTRHFSPAEFFVQRQEVERRGPETKEFQQKMIKLCPNCCPGPLCPLPPILDFIWVGGSSSVSAQNQFLLSRSRALSTTPKLDNSHKLPRALWLQRSSGSFPSETEGWDLIRASLLFSRDTAGARGGPAPSHQGRLGSTCLCGHYFPRPTCQTPSHHTLQRSGA